MQKPKNSKCAPSGSQKLRAFGKKLLYSALVMGAACYCIFFFAPFTALADSSSAIAYTHRDVWHILALFAGFVFTLGTSVLLTLEQKAFRITLTVLFSLTLCCYLQNLLMNPAADSLSGSSYPVNVGLAVFNLLLWVAVFVGCFYVSSISPRLWKRILLFGTVGILAIQGISTLTTALNADPDNTSIEEYSFSTESMYTFSSEDNVFVFVVDRFDYYYLNQVLEQDPDFFNKLDGFTGYTNAVCAYARPKPALNNMLTGSEQAYFVSTDRYLTESWTEGGKDLLGGLQEKDYSVDLYVNPTYLFGKAAYAKKNVDNITRNYTLEPAAVFPNLLRLCGYQCMPNAIKGVFWANSDVYNHNVYTLSGVPGYEFNDPLYGQGFRDATADRENGSFKFYHFFGSHNPYTMNADGTAAAEGQTPTAADQTMGCFQNLYRAFDRMKALGIYEDATIIITADHGRAISDGKPVQEATRIGLFYKPAGSAGTPLTWSDAPVSTGNIPATIAQAAGFEDIALYGTPLDQVAEDAQITRPYYKTICPKGSGPEVDVYEYIITGDAADLDNWEVVKVTEGIPPENSFY